MKLKTTPTSPKKMKGKEKMSKKEIEKLYQNENLKNIHKPKRRSTTSLVTGLILAALFGLLGGIAGEVFLNAYIFSQPGLAEQLILTNQNDTPVTVITERNTEETLTSELSAQASSGMVKIFKSQPNEEQNLLLASQSIGNGAILSSDGLIVTTDQVINDLEADYFAVTSGKKIYTVLEIFEDPISPLVIFKIEASGLSVNNLANRSNNELGQSAILIQNLLDGTRRQVKIGQIEDSHYQIFSGNGILSSEIYSDYLKLDVNFDRADEAWLAINQQGYLLGLSYDQEDSAGLLIASDLIESAMDSFLQNGEIIRNQLGVQYLDLSLVLDQESDLSQGSKVGALLYSDEQTGGSAVLADSPAEQAGLQWGDAILNLGKNEINQYNNLASLIQEYPQGQTVDCTVLRDNKELEVSISFQTISPEE